MHMCSVNINPSETVIYKIALHCSCALKFVAKMHNDLTDWPA